MIDELVIAGVIGRETGRQPPDFQVQQRQERRIGVATWEGVSQADAVAEGLLEMDRQTVPGVGRLLLDEVDDGVGVAGTTRPRRLGQQAGIGGRDDRAVEGDIGHEADIEQVQEVDRAIGKALHHPALEELDRESLEGEDAARGVAEGSARPHAG